MERFIPSRRNPRAKIRHLLAGALAVSVGAVGLPLAAAQAAPITELVLSEIMYNPTGPDSGNEWIELFNGTGTSIDLSSYSLGYGGGDYSFGTVQLSGSVASGDYFVIGSGPGYDLDHTFAPTLQNPILFPDGVALFDTLASSITPTSVPIDAVIYDAWGIFGNVNNLLDSTGNPGAVDVVGAPGGESVSLGDTGWAADATPSPGGGTLLTPEPSTGLLLLFGLVFLAQSRGSRRR